MIKQFIYNLKMLVRNRQALFWSFAFPLMFTVIFGFFFGGENSQVGSIALVNNSDTEIANSLEEGLKESEIFKVVDDKNIEESREMLEKGNVLGIVRIPEDFGAMTPDSPKQVEIIYNPANSTTNQAVISFVDKFLTNINYKVTGAEPIYSVKTETSVSEDLTYFDFVLVGLIGLALMNSSVQGIAITLSKYREDKILKRLTTTPMKVWKFVLAEVFSRLVLNFFQIVAVVAIGFYGFGANIAGNIPLLLLVSLIGALLFQLLGFTVASLSKTTDAAQGMSVAITIPMMFLAGVFFPIDQLPNWLYSIVKFLPLAPLLRMLRGVGLEEQALFADPTNIYIVLAWIVGLLVFVVYKFRLTEE